MTTATQILNQAKKWLGYSEANGKFKQIIDVYNSHRPLARGYKLKYSDEWCDGFVSSCAIKCGAVDIIGTEVGVPRHVDIFKKKGIWLGRTRPKVGDIIVYDWNRDGSGDHIGYVLEVNDNYIVVIEGNYNEVVAKRTIAYNHNQILGYARPKYVKEEKPKKKTVSEIAKEVIQGKWGNGQDRINKLKKEGYDYNAVQREVNRLLNAKPKKSNTEIAKEVIQGKWGNGADRKQRLEKEGYNYNTIQSLVNKML